MRYSITVILAFIFFISGKTQNESLLLKIENKMDILALVEIYGYPIENYPNNRAIVFDGIMRKDSIFIIEFDGEGIYTLNEISPYYSRNEYEGFIIYVYEPMENERIVFGGTPKDTLYYKDFDLKTLFIKPIEIIID